MASGKVGADYSDVVEDGPGTAEGFQAKLKAVDPAVPMNEDGSRRRGPRRRDGESQQTGFANTREKQEAYVEWLVTPKSERLPPTKQAVADLLGVVPRTLGYWDKDSWVQRQVSKRTKNLAKIQNASTILEALYTTATDVGNSRQVSAAKVYLDYVDEKVEDISAEDLEELTDAQLLDLIGELHDRIEDKIDG